MKSFLKNAGYKFSAVLAMLAMSQTAVWAEDGKTISSPALSGVQVAGGVALIIAAVVIPAFKSSRKLAVK